MQQRLNAGRGQILIRFRIVPRQMAGKADKLRVHLINADTWLEPAHHRRRGIVWAEPQVTAWNRRIFIVERDPQFLKSWEFKIWRHHADDGRRFAVYPNALSNN